MNPGNELIKIKQCHHSYHKSCLLTWFNQSPKCPMCRYDIRRMYPEDSQETPVSPSAPASASASASAPALASLASVASILYQNQTSNATSHQETEIPDEQSIDDEYISGNRRARRRTMQ
jgi:E3 ubiquitin-protein ligase DOA10